VYARLFRNPLQLSYGAGPAYASRNYSRLDPRITGHAYDLRGEVRMEGIEDEQIGLEYPGVQVKLFYKLLRVLDKARQHLGDLYRDHLKVGMLGNGLQQALAVLASSYYANQHEPKDEWGC